MSLIKVNKNKNPYHIIGEYIEKHITYIDDIIAVISLDGNIINELFLVEITTESNFIWQNDWWEGEENVELIDFFFVSDACKRCDNNDLISRQATIDALRKMQTYKMFSGDDMLLIDQAGAMTELMLLPSAQPEIMRCKDCKYWVPGYITDNDDFIPPKCGEWQQMVGHSSDDYCSLAERRED